MQYHGNIHALVRIFVSNCWSWRQHSIRQGETTLRPLRVTFSLASSRAIGLFLVAAPNIVFNARGQAAYPGGQVGFKLSRIRSEG